MPLRPRSLPRHRRSRRRHDLQLLDLHQEGHLASDRAARAFRSAPRQGDLATYQFNTKVAKHHFCKVCGIHPFYVPRSDPDKIDVNARCLDGFDALAITPKRFDGRNWEAAMQRSRTCHGDETG